MGQKIGELLVSEGLLTRKQLEEALKCQVIFGGRLGTNLVEMGIVEEHDLLRTLSKQLEIPFVASEQLSNVPPDVIKLIPKEMAEEYKIIPLSLEKKRLTVAMADPSDLAAVDAISFITGYIILPVVCSELRLLLALEQYYSIKREVRYIQLSGGTGTRSREAGPKAPQPAKPQEISPFQDLAGESLMSSPAKPLAGDPEWGELSEILPTESNTEPPPEILDISALQANTPAEEADIVELVEPQPEVKPSPQPPPAITPPPAPSPAQVKGHDFSSVESVLATLAEAKDRDTIAEALATYVSRDYERVALFMVKGKVAAGWKGFARQKGIAGFEHFQIPLDDPSALKIIVDTKNFYLGPMLDTEGNKRIQAALGGGTPETVLLIPLIMMERVVTIFYVDGGKDPGKNLFELQKLAGKAAVAFEILILKNKILLG